jgi:hypothetical protein
LRKGFEFLLIEKLVNVSDDAMRRHLFEVMRAVEPWSRSQIEMPTVEDWYYFLTPQELKTAYPNTLFFFVDGTVIEKWDSDDTKVARASFNTKHNIPAYVFFVLVAPNGRIVYLSDVRLGSTHDKTHWGSSSAVSMLNKAYPYLDTNFNYALGGDKAYPGLKRPNGWLSYVTMTAEEEVEEGKAGVDYIKDPDTAPYRGVVERAIGAIKRWQILENIALISRLTFAELELLLLTISALTNYQLKIRNKPW